MMKIQSSGLLAGYFFFFLIFGQTLMERSISKQWRP